MADGGVDGEEASCRSAVLVPGDTEPDRVELPDDEGDGGSAASSCSSSGAGVPAPVPARGETCSEEERLDGAR